MKSKFVLALACSLTFAVVGLAAETPVARTRLALCEPLSQKGGVAQPVMPVAWFKAAAEKAGCTLTVLSYREVTDSAVLTTNRFDTLILPAQAMPFECEDTALRFLQQGGTVITRSVIPHTYRITADCKTEDEFVRKHGAHQFREHSYGWYAPFLIRQDPSPQGRRTLKEALPLTREATAILGDLLPAELPANGSVSYALLNRWEQVHGFEGGYGDPANYALAADCEFHPYVDKTGAGTDFYGYRFYNARIFGSTLVQIGVVGAKLLQGPQGEDVFKAMLKMAEVKFPGEHDADYGRVAVRVQRDWSEFCFTYFETLGALRDAAAYAYEKGGDWAGLVARLGAVERRYSALFARRAEQKSLLRADKEPARARAAGEALVADLAQATREFKAETQAAEAILADARAPAKVAVRNRMGTVVSIASSVMPMSLGRARGDCFDVIRRIGSNVTSTHPLGTWFTEDPAVREKLKGFWRDFKFLYATCPAFAIGGDRLNPANGTITKSRDITLDESKVRKTIETWVSDFAFLGTNRFYRIGTGDETGMGFGAWGETAVKKFHTWLEKRYGTVAAMNDASGLACKAFGDLKAPLRQPKTQAEHATWELWRTFREDWVRELNLLFVRNVKAVCPSLETFLIPSTGSYGSPVYCLDHYGSLLDVDQSGVDGTGCADDYEWQYADICPQGRFMTAEWGGLYQEADFQKLYGKLWKEMAAGSWGAEQHRWSYGHDACNYADHTDIPTRYGAMLWAWLKDVRKCDPILMDGTRATPEVLILYSHTSRLHDQSWGWAGEKVFSPHMYAVAAYYGLFLDYGRNARVIDERALLAGKASGSSMPRVLIVPQARYLSPEVQQTLIAYAEQGGHLVLEGRVGAFDGFGRPRDLIFRKISVLPFNGPKPVTVSLGKGSVTFTGADKGLEKTADFAASTEGILRSLGLSERFAVSDATRMCREWTYDGATYLLLTSNNGKSGTDWGIGEVEIAVRGTVELEDWLTGARLKTRHEDGYTIFKTLAVNGGRVFKIVSGAIAPADDKAARARKPRYAGQGAVASSDVQDVALPYAGKIYDTVSVRAGDTVFANTTLSSGYRPDDGETYLTMRAPGVESRKRIEPGKTYYWRSRTRTFKVVCEKVFQMYPFFSVVKIEEVAEMPAAARAKATQCGGDVALDNGLVELDFDTSRGGGLKSLKLSDERVEQIVNENGFALIDAMPGPFRALAMEPETKEDASGVTLRQTLKGTAQGYSFVQDVRLASDAAEIGFDFKIGNRNAGVKKLTFNYHPEMILGSAADSTDMFVAPRKDGIVRAVPHRGVSDAIRFRKPTANWLAVVDTKERLALVTEFDPSKTLEMYVWDAPAFFTIEPSSPQIALNPNETFEYTFGWRYFRGLTGIDAAVGRFAAHLTAPAVWDQSKPLAATLEIATANRRLCTAKAKVWILSGDKTVAELAVAEPGKVAFDLPAASDVTGSVASLKDGDYVIAVEVETVADGAAPSRLAFCRPIKFAGGQLARIAAFCAAKAKEISALESSVPADRIFDLKLALKALEQAVSESRLDDAEHLMRDFPECAGAEPVVTVDGCVPSAKGARVTLSSDGVVSVSATQPISTVCLVWKKSWSAGARFLNDAWERSTGDLRWQSLADKMIVSPWYFLVSDDGRTDGYGVRVQPNALCCWKIERDGYALEIDVTSGGRPVRLNGRTLAACTIVTRRGNPSESAFAAGREFCRMMCPKPRLAKTPVYGYNDWYCAYGKNTATNFLADAAFVCSLSEGLANRPYVVMDDGWQPNSPPVIGAYVNNGPGSSGYGPWERSGETFGMEMGLFAARVKALGAHPGLWYRPYRCWPGVRADLKAANDTFCFDPTLPAVKQMIFEDVSRFRRWGFDLVKIDYLTKDLCNLYGAEMGDRVFHADMHWRDDTRTSAEIILDLHRTMRAAAGEDMVIIGCNALNHLVAGIFELQRTGGDTSGWKWEQTRQNGINTLAMRAIQDRIFFAVDADCAGLAREGAVSWVKNRQWIDLLGRSGTPLFISWKRELATPEVTAALKAAFRAAATPRAVAEPQDWMTRVYPRTWLFADGVTTYDWEGCK